MTTDENELSLLREIRDSMIRQEKYFEERDKRLNDQFAEDAKRQRKLQATGQILVSALLIALWVIAVIQVMKYFRSTL
jgi:hypothetical protein